MKSIAIYTLTSELHDENAVGDVMKEFLGSLSMDYDYRAGDYTDYGSHTLSLIYVCTGGTEGIFLRLLPQLQAQSKEPFYLLTSGKSNSLAASMEILSYLRQHGLKGEILHGSAEYISNKVKVLQTTAEARRQLKGTRLGVIGKPSDWLIASHTDYNVLKERLGIELIDIAMQELLDTYKGDIHKALKTLVDRHDLQGFTLRCFDLLTAVRDTGCMALAKLNAAGYVAGCEGDVPAAVTMLVVRALTGVSGFQANPASIDPERGEAVFAHCTIPLDMVERYELDTHFESGIGTGIRGYMKEGAVTIFKLSGDLSRHFIAEGQLIRNESKPDRCRTQLVIRLDDKSQTNYFLTNPIGNHHIIMPGHCKEIIEQFLVI